MSRRKKSGMAMLALLAIQPGLISKVQRTEIITSRDAIPLAIIGVASVGTYALGPRIYNTIQAKITNKVDEEMVNSLILMVTPNVFMSTLEPEQRALKLQKKARLMSNKIRITKSLELLLNNEKTDLSGAHKKQLRENLDKAKALFESVDKLDNVASLFSLYSYKGEYHEPSYLGRMIEDKILKSIILSSKPIGECTAQEKAARIKGQERIKHIIANKIGDISEEVYLPVIIGMLFGSEIKIEIF